MSQVTFAEKNGELLPENGPKMLVAVGSNMSSAKGNPTETTRAGIELLRLAGAVIRAKSRLYLTPAFPPGSGPDFVNAALVISAPWSAREALKQLHDVEAKLGRSRKARWEQRVIDLDLLAYGNAVVPDAETVRNWMGLPLELQMEAAPDQMILPHPRLHERAFVLVPLADVASDWMHPGLGKSVAEMVNQLSAADLKEIKPLD